MVSGATKRLTFPSDSTREPITLAVLLALAVALFAVVSGLSRLHDAQQQALAENWAQRGAQDMQARRYADAVADFHTALLYRRGDDTYALNLAKALLGNGQTDEAHSYLTNIWEREPENGMVNLELARIADKKGENVQAIRYYHNAIYAAWPKHEEGERLNARFELVNLLLRNKDETQAQAELIALAENIDDDPATAVRIGNLFLEAQDHEHALSEFELALKVDEKNAAALAGAGRAAFELGRFAPAARYLRQAVEAAPGDQENASRLRIARLVLDMDPFRQEKIAKEREQAVVNAFAAAGKRLSACGGPTASTEQQMLAQQWAGLKPRVTEARLRANPDLVNEAMALVFRVERESVTMCSAGTDTDAALLLIAMNHEGL
jgi:tetratricopeptide (TPR) repeat protein